MKNYAKEFFKAFLNDYKTLVETNFLSKKEEFGLYSKLPVHIIDKLEKTKEEPKPGRIYYVISEHDGDENLIQVREDNDEELEIQTRDDGFLSKPVMNLKKYIIIHQAQCWKCYFFPTKEEDFITIVQ